LPPTSKKSLHLHPQRFVLLVGDSEVEAELAALGKEVEGLAGRCFAPRLEAREAQILRLRPPQVELTPWQEPVDVLVGPRDRAGEESVLCKSTHQAGRRLERGHATQHLELALLECHDRSLRRADPLAARIGIELTQREEGSRSSASQRARKLG
jgi:hypothetical protein